jgi:hypothetical protein
MVLCKILFAGIKMIYWRHTELGSCCKDQNISLAFFCLFPLFLTIQVSVTIGDSTHQRNKPQNKKQPETKLSKN